MTSHLAIEASKAAVKFSVLRDKRVRETHFIQFDETGSQARKSELSDRFSELPISKVDFDEITLSWSNAKSTIIPNFVLNDSDPNSIYTLCYGTPEDAHSVDYNRIAEIGVINIYEIPDWIKSYFVIKFPRIAIQHTGSHLVRQIMHENAFYLKATILLFDGYFLLSMAKHNKLEFYSFFDFTTAEDVIYHLSFALQQKELSEEKGTLEIVAGINTNLELQKELEIIKSKVKDLKQLELKIVEDFIAKSQLLCV